jgi:hypothetical protein
MDVGFEKRGVARILAGKRSREEKRDGEERKGECNVLWMNRSMELSRTCLFQK